MIQVTHRAAVVPPRYADVRTMFRRASRPWLGVVSPTIETRRRVESHAPDPASPRHF
jgi:hypothetical protein